MFSVTLHILRETLCHLAPPPLSVTQLKLSYFDPLNLQVYTTPKPRKISSLWEPQTPEIIIVFFSHCCQATSSVLPVFHLTKVKLFWKQQIVSLSAHSLSYVPGCHSATSFKGSVKHAAQTKGVNPHSQNATYEVHPSRNLTNYIL